MKIEFVERILIKLADLIKKNEFEALETDRLELKPVPANDVEWQEPLKTICAFLNTRGGILILGIKEESRSESHRYVFTGYKPHLEGKIKDLANHFVDRDRHKLDLGTAFVPPYLIDFLDGQVVVLAVEALPVDKKYAFYKGVAYRRDLTGDHKIPEAWIEQQEEFKREAIDARELQPVQGLTEDDLDIDKLNQFIMQFNQGHPIATLKSNIASAHVFLTQRSFIKDDKVTLLGALVCANRPGDVLGFRCQVHGYVDSTGLIAQDKQVFIDNVLPLMNASFNYIWRSIQVGISAHDGGSRVSQYPENLIRETINNALAHRDYTINRQIIVIIKPNQHISIQNPGAFRKQLLIEYTRHTIPIRRISPESKARNPKLAEVLRVYDKWEGRGIGMATLVNLCLQNEIDMPYYLLGTDEVTLFLQAGRLVDERMINLFRAFDGYIENKLQGMSLTESQKRVLAYLIKSEEANAIARYTIMLTPNNNHFSELHALKEAKLIYEHEHSTPNQIIYVVDRTLIQTNYLAELRELFGVISFDSLDITSKEVLSVIYRFNHFSKARTISAKQAGLTLWAAKGERGDYKVQDTYLRKIRMIFNRLTDAKFIEKVSSNSGYQLNKTDAISMLKNNE